MGNEKTWNPWLLPLPPTQRLISEVTALQERLNRNSFGRGDIFECHMVADSVEKLNAFGNTFGTTQLCKGSMGAEQTWDMLVKTVQRIAKDTKD